MSERNKRMGADQAAAWATLNAAAQAAATRGSLLFHLDLATELARDALAQTGSDAGTLATLIDAGGYRVLCVTDGVPARAAASVSFAADGRPLVERASLPASAAAEHVAAARRAVEREAPAGPNAAVIVVPPSPRAGRAPIEAYAFALGDRPGDIVLGVHHRLTLTDDGRRITAREPLSRTANALSAGAGRSSGWAQVTHFGAVPGEHHTYLSLKHGLVFEVLALDSSTRWQIDGERTAAMGTIEP